MVLFILRFSITAHSGVCSRMSKLAECSTSLGGKVHAWSTQVSSFNPNDCVASFQPSQAVFGVHVFFVCRAECFTGVHTCENIVKCPPGSRVGGNKKRSIINGTSSCRTEIKRTCVTFLPALANDGGHWTIWNYVSIVGILLCEIKYRYCGLWWMERVSQISVMSTLKTFPKWPYKEFLKRCLLRIKRSNWWKKLKASWILTAHFFLISVSPLTFYFGFEWDISKHTSWKIQAAKVYTQWWDVAESSQKTIITKKGICSQIT